MGSTYVIIHLFLTIIFLLAFGMRAVRSNISRFELTRRSKLGDTHAKNDLNRERSSLDIDSLFSFIKALLLVILAFVGLMAYGIFWGTVIVLSTILLSGFITRNWPFRVLSRSLYQKFEFDLIKLCDKFPKFIKLIRTDETKLAELRLGSSDDLIHLLEKSDDALTGEQLNLLLGGLVFGDRLVKDAMVGKSKIISVKKSEILGPVVLNDLHSSGHSHFPVINRDIDHVVGILDVSRLLVISGDSRASSGVESVMDKYVRVIDKNEKLETALRLFIKDKTAILIVQNDNKETVGLLTLGDIIQVLFGRALTEASTEN